MTQQNFTVDNGLTVAGSGGNISGANNIISNNVIANTFAGQQPNVEILANTASWTFDTLGTLTAPGDIITPGNVSAGGNIDIDGEARFGGNVVVVGNIDFSGGGSINQIVSANGVFTGDANGFGALYAGTPGYTPVPASVAQFTSDANDYTQINAQNLNHGNIASMEYVITGDLGTDTTDYLDIGFSSSTWDGTQTNSLGTAVKARDGYIYVQGGGGGGNLVIGTTTSGKSIKFNVGGPNSGNTVGEIFATGLSMVGNVRSGNILTTGEVSATGNIIANNIGNVAALNLNGNASTVLYGNGVFAAVAAGSSYGDSNVVTLLSAFGSNTVSTTGNVTSGNVNTGGLVSATGNVTGGNVRTVGLVSATGNVYAGGNSTTGFILGNVNSKIGILGSNATITMSQNIVVSPDQAGSPNAGLQVAGGGYILAPNGARVFALSGDGSATVTTNLSLPNGGNIVASTGNLQVGGNITRTGSITQASWGSAGVGLKLSPATYTDNSTVAGTLAAQYIHSMGAPTFSFSNAVTVTNAATLFVNSPTAGANATLTNAWSIYTNGNIGTATLSASGNVTGGNVLTAGLISAAGNVTAANFIGNISITGNVTGTSSNVTLVAGSYSTVFDNTGVATFPGNVSVTGNVITPNRPAFRVYGTSGSNIPTGTTVTSTQGATVDYNQGSYYNNTTGIFTAPVAGIYSATATLRVGSTSGLNQASIQKNSSGSGANVIAFWECTGNSASNGFGHMSMAGTTKLAVGDTLRLQVLSGNINFDPNDSWAVTFIG